MRDPRRILVGTDFSADADRALDVALAIAARTLGEVHLVHAFTYPSVYYSPYEIALPVPLDDEARKAAQKALAERETRVRAAGCFASSHLGVVPSASCISDHARKLGADLVVLGSRGLSGWRRVVLGSVAENTVRLSPASVLTVRGDGHAELPKVIVAGVDFSNESARALGVAADWARGFRARLHLVHGFHQPAALAIGFEARVADTFLQQARARAAAQLETLAKSLGDMNVKGEVVDGPAVHALDDVARREHADLIVTGSHSRSGLAHALLGSVAERTLRFAPCSVLTVKAPFGGA